MYRRGPVWVSQKGDQMKRNRKVKVMPLALVLSIAAVFVCVCVNKCKK